MREKGETKIVYNYRNGNFVSIKIIFPKETITCNTCRNEIDPKLIVNGICISCIEKLEIQKIQEKEHLQELNSMSKEELINKIIELENNTSDC